MAGLIVVPLPEENKDGDSELEDICRCSVCLECYTDPKLLPCQHCFCKECLEDILNVRVQGGIISFNKHIAIVCPFCRAICKFENGMTLSSLKKNLQLAQVLDLLHKRSPGKPLRLELEELSLANCSRCLDISSDLQRGILKCVDCRAWYCTVCFKQSHVDPPEGDSLRAGHIGLVCRLDRDGKPSFYCKEHNFVLKYHCNDCQKIACVDCCLSSHKTHEIRTLAFVANTAREDLKPYINDAAVKLDVMLGLSNECEQSLLKLESRTEDILLSQVRQRKTEILDEVNQILNASEINLIQSWRERKEGIINDLTSNKETLEMAEASGRSILDGIGTEMNKDIDLIAETDSYKKDLKRISVPSIPSISTECLDYLYRPHTPPADQRIQSRRAGVLKKTNKIIPEEIRKGLNQAMGYIGPSNTAPDCAEKKNGPHKVFKKTLRKSSKQRKSQLDSKHNIDQSSNTQDRQGSLLIHEKNTFEDVLIASRENEINSSDVFHDGDTSSRYGETCESETTSCDISQDNPYLRYDELIPDAPMMAAQKHLPSTSPLQKVDGESRPVSHTSLRESSVYDKRTISTFAPPTCQAQRTESAIRRPVPSGGYQLPDTQSNSFPSAASSPRMLPSRIPFIRDRWQESGDSINEGGDASERIYPRNTAMSTIRVPDAILDVNRYRRRSLEESRDNDSCQHPTTTASRRLTDHGTPCKTATDSRRLSEQCKQQ